MRAYGDSDKPDGAEGYDTRELAEEFHALGRRICFGAGRQITLVAFGMGAPPALLGPPTTRTRSRSCSTSKRRDLCPRRA